MPISTEVINQASLAGIPILPLIRDSLYGVLGLIVVIAFHGGFINFVMIRFERLTNQNLKKKQYDRVFFHFYASFLIIALIHLLEIIIWTIYIIRLNLIDDGLQTLLFVGSCYTTVGFVSDILPAGWKSLAFFISFSGLFSIAWTTSTMIGMTATFKAAWNIKHHQNDPTVS
ncbi:hypothetical protein [Polynucleobacter sp. AP-Reno-20A-A9]|uniref:hypothetical protein n=1 Tax=Polynucleobacter sp. AP-Reno-20A-A9 TaxID=2576925 RepID=UPI001C0D126F|nr:hypothetical protein [Polynucleobacter sp. AP-Reno-20A-A9]MBU3627963.1 hypothetical protein [Polynucleobacter sp. AP-Reno-20A-A9]